MKRAVAEGVCIMLGIAAAFLVVGPIVAAAAP